MSYRPDPRVDEAKQIPIEALIDRLAIAGLPLGGRVLDPFGGAGTTALVADKFGADCTLIELSEDYIDIIRERLATGLVQMSERAKPNTNNLPLFKVST